MTEIVKFAAESRQAAQLRFNKIESELAPPAYPLFSYYSLRNPDRNCISPPSPKAWCSP